MLTKRKRNRLEENQQSLSSRDRFQSQSSYPGTLPMRQLCVSPDYNNENTELQNNPNTKILPLACVNPAYKNENTELQNNPNMEILPIAFKSSESIFSPGTSPLGLKLRKSPSFLELLQKELCGSDKSGSFEAETDLQSSDNRRPNLETEKFKAANFQATLIQIGTWQRSCQCAGDLIGKCYYSKRKMVWEVLDNGLKNKMEIQWSDITALKAEFPEGKPGVLAIELSRPPLFFHEITPQARKHTLWHSTSDFTDGQASICRVQTIQFPTGVFDRHYENLLLCDERLMALSKAQKIITNTFFVDMECRYKNQSHQQTQHHFSNLANHAAPPPYVPSTPININVQNTNFPYNNYASFPNSTNVHQYITKLEPSNTHQCYSFPAYNHNLVDAQAVYRTPNPTVINEMLRNETLKYGIGGGALNMQQILPNHSLATSPELDMELSTNISNPKFSGPGHELTHSTLLGFYPMSEMKTGLDESSSTITNVDELDNGDETFMCQNLSSSHMKQREQIVRHDMFFADELINGTTLNEEQGAQCQAPLIPSIFNNNDITFLGQGQPINKPIPTIFNNTDNHLFCAQSSPSCKVFQTNQVPAHTLEAGDQDGFFGWMWD